LKKAAIITDGRPGHFNQSIALCKHLSLDYELVDVVFKSNLHRLLSYMLDRLGIYTDRLFRSRLPSPDAQLVISAGSTTFYANKVLSRKLDVPNISILHAQGYRLDFSHIFCPAYDQPPKRDNITEIPLNLCAADPATFAAKTDEFNSIHPCKKPAIGIIVGGPNAVSEIDPSEFRAQLEKIFELTEGYERWITTSRRTPKKIEAIVDAFTFDYALINSRDSYNPVPAFIQICDRLFVTSDSASMISECASFGTAKVEILMNRQLKTPNKFEILIHGLEKQGAVHLFDGTLGSAHTKIDLGPILQKPLKKIL